MGQLVTTGRRDARELRRRRARGWAACLLAAALVTGLMPSSAAGVSNVKLNGALVSEGDVSAGDFEISPDGSRVVYQADQDINNVTELYSVPIEGGTPVKLNEPFGDDDGMRGPFAISPDGARVVYGAVKDDGIGIRLYSVPIGGGTPVVLNGTLVSGGNVDEFRITADPPVPFAGIAAVYLADQDVDEVFELYRAPIGGGTATKLSQSLTAGGDVTSFRVSADGNRAVYRADADADEVFELYSMRLTLLGWAIQLNHTLPEGGDVSWAFRISPDGSQVVYVADGHVDGVDELYSVPIEGGTPVRLNDAMVSGGDVSWGFRISPDGSHVVYEADQDVDNVWELHSVPIGGGTPVKLNGALPSGGHLWEFDVSPDGSRVVYVAEQDVDNVQELYSVPIGGGTPAKLNGPLVSGGRVGDFRISPDGSRVVYEADQDVDEVFEIYGVPIGGGTPVKLNGTLAQGGVVMEHLISPAGGYVAYVADQDTDGMWELYSVPIGGGTPVKLSGTMVSGGNVDPEVFGFSPDGAHVVYRADQDTAGVHELYASTGFVRWQVFLPLTMRNP